MAAKQERFWKKDNFVVITDGTKPAMKWTIDELRKKRTVHVLDLYSCYFLYPDIYAVF